MKANVIVFSYNRPQMLRQALWSVFAQSKQDFDVWVIDDGSDTFDPEELLEEFQDERLILAKGPRMTPEERISTPERFAENVNHVLDQLEEGFVVYLCDDDWFHPYWLKLLDDMFEEGKYHVAYGRVYHFYDEGLRINNFQDMLYYMNKAKLGYPTGTKESTENILWWNVGNVANLVECNKIEGVRWGDGRWGKEAHSWDVQYFNSLRDAHMSTIMIQFPSIYVRVHNNSVSYKIGRMENGQFIKQAGSLKAEDVVGSMEN